MSPISPPGLPARRHRLCDVLLGRAPLRSALRHLFLDASDVAVIDQLSYADEDPYGYGWRRSITVTPERVYVAGIEWDGSDEGHSTNQVIDISDLSGLLIKGGSVEAAG